MKELYQEYDVKMQKTIEVVVSDFAGVRAGRANAAVLDKITVEYYGTETPIQQVASISTPDARTLVIQPWRWRRLCWPPSWASTPRTTAR